MLQGFKTYQCRSFLDRQLECRLIGRVKLNCVLWYNVYLIFSKKKTLVNTILYLINLSRSVLCIRSVLPTSKNSLTFVANLKEAIEVGSRENYFTIDIKGSPNRFMRYFCVCEVSIELSDIISSRSSA